MSAKENPCRKFQANIFNKSKCQNCFRPRESHALIDEDLSQAKPIYGGWLLLAPEGTDFDNPVQRSRKWQRRFFILYEHGLLRYALDEMPSTLPQGTINMNQCLDVVDGEKRTSQKNSLCVVTPEKEHFIRAENKEIINGWFETLIVYPRTNKQNQKKKRKVEPPTPQEGPHTSAPLSSGDMNGHIEPGPAKVAVTSSGASSSTLTTILSVEKVPSSKSTLWQEEPRGRSHIPCSRSTPSLCQLSQASVPPAVTTRAPKAESESGSTEHVDGGRKARVESGYFSLEKTKPEAKTPEETLPQPPQHLQYASPSRYSYPDAESPNPCRSPEYSDPFLSPGPFHSNGSSAISSSQSSLDSEASSTTQTSGASWESRGAGGGGTQIEKTGACQASRNTREYATLADIPKAKRISNRDAFQVERKRLEQRTRARSPGREEVVRLFGQERRRSQVIEKFETLDVENAENMETSSAAIAESSSSEPQGTCVGSTRLGRSARRAFPRKQEFTMEASKGGSVPEASSLPVSPYRRAKSLDRRTTESSITPDLLNFKKGWMTKLYQDGVWKKHWFVLTDQSLRFYRDSIAEEAADLDGEIDLSTCFDVTEFPVQRNYGFQIHTKDRVFTLSAMTSGIRRNWVQAITKSIRPSTAPDVTSSLPEEKAVAKPSSDTRVTVDGTSEVDGSHAVKKAGARERRRDGRSKTFDWAEFRPTQQLLAQEREPAMAEVPVSPPVGPAAPVEAQPRTNASAVTDLEKERAWRREVRRKRFETADVSFVSNQDDAKIQMEVDRSQAVVLESKSPSVRVEIEERWHQVETTPLREEKQIPISTLHSSAPVSESVPPQDLAPLLLDKELEQTQKELRSLQHQNRLLQEQLKEAQSREQNAREGYVLQATCERGFAAMEETHQKVIEDIHRQHQRELDKLLEEKERLLAEETAATIAAIEAMKNAHRVELEKTQRAQITGMSADIEELRRQYQEELQSLYRELEVLSQQYSQKCLENAHLAQALEAERQALQQCQRENQELNAHNQELNTRLAAEITRLRSCITGEGGDVPLTQGKDSYELEVLLRVKESEIQYLKQEIHSLKDELQTALKDKKYATDKYKDIYTELSIAKAKADCDISKLKEQLIVATEALGDTAGGSGAMSGYDIMKSKSNPDFLKKERASASRQTRSSRSKSDTEQVSWDS
ncbi:myosin phosphatase Rho-interacting protein-like isoform X4 [Erpetoichthys calabaricus]|uniref:myosin phosphatase Rho-interacting protein-like isoform X4 n=1 Tax=Erpetoichthys calabaricus TaxID=27687 RepID=UPI00223465A4|nr:myosin phosphatase Rho-interacting protein-like isoform X4 [Erpetoichthys calabaricus]